MMSRRSSVFAIVYGQNISEIRKYQSMVIIKDRIFGVTTFFFLESACTETLKKHGFSIIRRLWTKLLETFFSVFYFLVPEKGYNQFFYFLVTFLGFLRFFHLKFRVDSGISGLWRKLTFFSKVLFKIIIFFKIFPDFE
jgi:hypothetical protein